MANKVTIDVEARFVDSVSDEAQKAAENVEDIGDAAKKAKKETDRLGKSKIKPTVDAEDSKFLKKIRAAEEKARKLGRTKTATVLSAVDKATVIMNKVMNKAKGIAGKTWKGIVAVKDSASSILKNVATLGKGIAGKTWTAIVKIKDTFTAPLRKLKDMLFNIKTLIGGIATAWAATKLVVNPINLADAYSSAQIGFSTLLGKSGGQNMMDKIDEFAKATPFKTAGVISNVQKMMAYGWDADRIIEDMKTIGDAAAATGKGDEGLSSIVYALSEIRSKGKLSTQELNQLASAGIKAKQYLAEGLGYGSDDAGLMKLAEDLESGAIGANQAIDLILEGMKEFDGMMDKTANETVAGLWSQIEDTFEINVFRKWGQGLQDGAKKGFGTIVDLLDSSDKALAELGDTLYDIGKTASNWLADKLEVAVKKINEITGSNAFKNATLGGKIKLLWSGVIGNPLAEWWKDTVIPWWDATVVPWLVEKARGIGEGLGKGLTGGISMLLGFDATGAIEDGVTIGGAFMEGFLEGFDTDKIGEALSNWVSENKGLATVLGTVLGIKLLSGLGNIVGNIRGLFGGGSGTGTGLGASYATATMDVTAGVVNVYGMLSTSVGASTVGNLGGKLLGSGSGSGTLLLPGTGGGTPLLTSGAGTAAGKVLPSVVLKDGTVAATGSGLTAGLAKFGVTLGSGATTAGGAAAAGAAGAGGILGLITGGISAGVDIFQGVKKGKAGDKKGAKDEYFSAGTKGGMMAAGAGIGAAIGSIIPGAGTAVGALVGGGIGGIVGMFTGDKAGKALSDGTDEGGWLSNAWDATKGFFTDTIPAAFNSFKEKASTFFTETIPEGWNNLWDSVGGFFTETVPAAWNTLTEKVSTFFTETVPEAWDSFWGAIESFFTETVPYALGYATGKVWTFFSETIPEAWNNFWDTVGAFFTETVPQFAGYVWGKVVKFFTETLPNAWNSFWDAVGTFFTETIPEWAETIWSGYVVPFFTESIPAFFSNLWTAIKEFFTETIPTWAETIWSGYIVPFFTESIPSFFSSLWNGIVEFFTETLPGWAETIWSGHIVPFFTETVPGWFTSLWDSVVSFFTETLPSFAEAVWSPISTFFTETIPGWVSSVWDKVTGWFNDVKDNFMSGFEAGKGDGGGGDGDGKKARGGIVGGGSSSMEAFARGGMVRGGAKLIKVAEEGNPEMIIPLSSQRRDRALKLWAKTGKMLGVDKYARGGRTSGRDEGIPFKRYEDDEPTGGKTVLIEVGGIHVEIHVHAEAGKSIAEAIQEQKAEIAEAVAGIMADALGCQFENTPLKGGVA